MNYSVGNTVAIYYSMIICNAESAVVIKGATNASVKAFAIEIIEIE